MGNEDGRERRLCCAVPLTVGWGEQEAEEKATALKALGHPVRLQIIDLLSRYAGQVCVCDIESQFDLSQPTISHHLKVLREAGLVDCERQGIWYYYFVRTEILQALQTQLSKWLASQVISVQAVP